MKKLSQLALALAALTLAPSAFAASILATTDGSKSLDNVKESASGTLTIEGRVNKNLVTVGAGIRTATLGIHAYEAELLVNDKSQYCAGGRGLPNLANLTSLAVRINVLFSFDKGKLVEALNTGFDSNGVDPSNPDVVNLMTKIKAGPDAPRGDLIVFAGERLPNGTEVVTYENQGKAVSVHGGSGFVASIFALWLGQTDDSGLKNLNKALVTCQM